MVPLLHGFPSYYSLKTLAEDFPYIALALLVLIAAAIYYVRKK